MKGYHVPQDGLSVGLAFWWVEDVNVSVLDTDKHWTSTKLDYRMVL